MPNNQKQGSQSGQGKHTGSPGGSHSGMKNPGQGQDPNQTKKGKDKMGSQSGSQRQSSQRNKPSY